MILGFKISDCTECALLEPKVRSWTTSRHGRVAGSVLASNCWILAKFEHVFDTGVVIELTVPSTETPLGFTRLGVVGFPAVVTSASDVIPIRRAMCHLRTRQFSASTDARHVRRMTLLIRARARRAPTSEVAVAIRRAVARVIGDKITHDHQRTPKIIRRHAVRPQRSGAVCVEGSPT